MPDSDTSLAVYDAYVEARHEHVDTRPLSELERELIALLLELEEQAAAWPKPARAIDRYAIGKRIERIDQRIGELYREIAAAEVRTIADVAVKLRRLQVVDYRSR